METLSSIRSERRWIAMITAMKQKSRDRFDSSIVEASRLTGQSFTEIRMIGGGSQIQPLVNRTREVTGLPVVTGPAEATSIGNLCIQAVAVGIFTTLRQARLTARRLDRS